MESRHDDLCDLLVREIQAVYRLAHHLCEQSDEVEGLVEETYLRAFACAEMFRQSDLRPRPRLLKILHKLIASRHPGRQGEPVSLAHSQEQTCCAANVSESDCFGLTFFQSEDVDERLRQALDSLSRSTRATLLLWAAEELTYREIAEVTDVSLETVTSRLRSGRSEVVASLSVPRQSKRPAHKNDQAAVLRDSVGVP